MSTPQNDEARKQWCREQSCCFRDGWIWVRGDESIWDETCRGRTEAAHEGRKPGVGMKCPDSETIPLCRRHHGDWTDHVGFFKGWTKAERREWADERIAAATAQYLSHGNRRAA